MKMMLFAGRNAKEIIRDPINLFFGLGFPLVLLFLFHIINQAIPPETQNTLFEIQNTAPGIAGSLSIVLLYTAVVYTLAVIIFRSRMKG